MRQKRRISGFHALSATVSAGAICCLLGWFAPAQAESVRSPALNPGLAPVSELLKGKRIPLNQRDNRTIGSYIAPEPKNSVASRLAPPPIVWPPRTSPPLSPAAVYKGKSAAPVQTVLNPSGQPARQQQAAPVAGMQPQPAQPAAPQLAGQAATVPVVADASRVILRPPVSRMRPAELNALSSAAGTPATDVTLPQPAAPVKAEAFMPATQQQEAMLAAAAPAPIAAAEAAAEPRIMLTPPRASLPWRFVPRVARAEPVLVKQAVAAAAMAEQVAQPAMPVAQPVALATPPVITPEQLAPAPVAQVELAEPEPQATLPWLAVSADERQEASLTEPPAFEPPAEQPKPYALPPLAVLPGTAPATPPQRDEAQRPVIKDARVVWRREPDEQIKPAPQQQALVLTPPTRVTVGKLERMKSDVRFEPEAPLAELAPAAGETVKLKAPAAATQAVDAALLQPLPTVPPQPAAEEHWPEPTEKLELKKLPAIAETKEAPLVLPEARQPDADAPLSHDSRRILRGLEPEKRAALAAPPPVSVKHLRQSRLPAASETEVKSHESYGIKMSVKRPRLDINRTLELAYDALVAGNQPEAIQLYQNVLEANPRNTMALFGLAATYHRAGQIDMARPLYGRLLEIDPHHVEGLNNFLVLLSDESPDAALEELEKLRATHPGFSPLPAQMAVIYEKKGDFANAARQMAQALAISPENLKYQYNMAIILDKMGDWERAGGFYQGLLTAHGRGEKIPVKADDIQQRLTFIRSNRTS